MASTTLVGLSPLIFPAIVSVRASSNYNDSSWNSDLICLDSTNCWITKVNDLNQYIMVGSAVPIEFRAIVTQGRPDADQRVLTYKVQYSLDGITFKDYKNGAVLQGNTDRSTKVTNFLNPPIKARALKFIPLTWSAHMSMRMEVYGKFISSSDKPTVNPLAKYFGKKVNIKSVAQDAYLRDNKGVIDLSATHRKLEEWTCEDAGDGKVTFTNTLFKKYLSCDSSDLLSHADNSDPTVIEWTGGEIRSGVFSLKSSNGKFLRAESTYDTSCDSDVLDEEHEFELVIV